MFHLADQNIGDPGNLHLATTKRELSLGELGPEIIRDLRKIGILRARQILFRVSRDSISGRLQYVRFLYGE